MRETLIETLRKGVDSRLLDADNDDAGQRQSHVISEPTGSYALLHFVAHGCTTVHCPSTAYSMLFL